MPKCDACGLYKGCRSPKMPVDGEGKKKILVIGEAPGEQEDRSGRPFVGPSGQILQDTLRKLGVELRRDCWVTNSLVCRPPGNEIPSPKMIDHCRPNVVKAVRDLRPEKIILLGSRAVESVIGWLWKPSPGGVMQWAGYKAPDRQINAWVCPTFHPSAILRQRDDRVMRLVFANHLEAALQLEGRPYEEVVHPKIDLIFDPDKAADIIRSYEEAGRAVAFDYETTHLSPYSEGSRILCCSLSDGERTAAFVWSKTAQRAMKSLLESKVKKLAHNAKFENVWSRVKFGANIRNWYWDAMVMHHCFDNRVSACGLKFLSYAVLGFKSYDDHIEPYRSGSGPHDANRLGEVPLPELLRYCGMDSYLNRKLAEIQCREAGVKL